MILRGGKRKKWEGRNWFILYKCVAMKFKEKQPGFFCVPLQQVDSHHFKPRRGFPNPLGHPHTVKRATLNDADGWKCVEHYPVFPNIATETHHFQVKYICKSWASRLMLAYHMVNWRNKMPCNQVDSDPEKSSAPGQVTPMLVSWHQWC